MGGPGNKAALALRKSSPRPGHEGMNESHMLCSPFTHPSPETTYYLCVRLPAAREGCGCRRLHSFTLSEGAVACLGGLGCLRSLEIKKPRGWG